MVAGMRARDLLLASVATARITRFVTVDKLGEWLIARRVRDWGGLHEREWLEAHLDPEGVREVTFQTDRLRMLLLLLEVL